MKTRCLAFYFFMIASSISLYAQPESRYSWGTLGDDYVHCTSSLNLINLKEAEIGGLPTEGWHTFIQSPDCPGGTWVKGRSVRILKEALRNLKGQGFKKMDLYTSSTGWRIKGSPGYSVEIRYCDPNQYLKHDPSISGSQSYVVVQAGKKEYTVRLNQKTTVLLDAVTATVKIFFKSDPDESNSETVSSGEKYCIDLGRNGTLGFRGSCDDCP